MQAFTALYAALDRTTKTNEKVDAMADYFRAARPADAAWALYFLSGRRPKRLLPSKRLRAWAAAAADVPLWLVEESRAVVGDTSEAIALLLAATEPRDERRAVEEPEAAPSDAGGGEPLHRWVENRILPLYKQTEDEQQDAVLAAWADLAGPGRFVFNKLLQGNLRVGVSQKLMVRALAQVSGIDEAALAHRLMGDWEPTPAFYTALLDPDTDDADESRPYPFFLAYPIEPPEDADPVAYVAGQLGDLRQWQVEWKWDGIRAQIVRRGGSVYVWSRGEELVTDRYPDVAAAAMAIPDGTVLDGELLAWKDGEVQPFSEMQRRIGRKTISKKMRADVPVAFRAFDLLEWDGRDVREEPGERRRALLDAAVGAVLEADAGLSAHLGLSEVVEPATWAEVAALRETAHERSVEGFMLKSKAAPYGVGRRRGPWWKWKVDPFTVDAVMLYAQAGTGRRATLHTDYTFGVWAVDEQTGDEQLVPFAKAYSGLTDAEIKRVDAWIRRHTLEKFGPVRRVEPVQVFELAFEGIRRSTRHKSGLAVRFPRILRWREDKPAAEAERLGDLLAMLPEE